MSGTGRRLRAAEDSPQKLSIETFLLDPLVG